MIAAAIVCFVAALIFVPGLYLELERIRKQHTRLKARYDRLAVTHSRTLNLLARERQKHMKTAVRAVKAERALERSDAALVEAGREAATHADHLEALLEATSEKGLRLVKGAER